jgi:acetyltransferase-like isoleucine patch superfamily enzyme
VRGFLVRVALAVMARARGLGQRSESLFRRLYLSDLRRRDMLQWRLEQAREMGVKVGEGSLLFSLNIFSEPFLVEIGDRVIVSGDVTFVTHDGGIYTIRDEIPHLNCYYGRIKVGNNCFIGMGAMILPNVQIGDNCIVAAGAVVMDSFPDNCVIVGNPARVAFSLGVYRQMRKGSPLTIVDEQHPYPEAYPRELLLARIGHIPIKAPRRAGPGDRGPADTA